MIKSENADIYASKWWKPKKLVKLHLPAFLSKLIRRITSDVNILGINHREIARIDILMMATWTRLLRRLGGDVQSIKYVRTLPQFTVVQCFLVRVREFEWKLGQLVVATQRYRLQCFYCKFATECASFTQQLIISTDFRRLEYTGAHSTLK